MTARAHLSLPLYEQDRNVVLSWASVRVYEADGMTLFKGTIYRDATSQLTFGNPFVVAPARLELWFDKPVRVVLGVQPDRSSIETLTPAIDVTPDADEVIHTVSPLKVTGDMVANGLLRADTTVTGVWFQPGLSPHDHHSTAPGTTRVGPRNQLASQVADFPGTTSVGSQNLAFAPPHAADFSSATMIGVNAFALGRDTVAVGAQAAAFATDQLPIQAGAIALGYRVSTEDGSTVIGREAAADPVSVAFGRSAQAIGEHGVALGAYASAPADSIALGFDSGAGESSVALGARLPMISATAEEIVLRSLNVYLASTLHADGDFHLGTRASTLSFFGINPAGLQDVGEDEPATGIEALDSLILALRELGLLRKRAQPLLTYDAGNLTTADGAGVTSWPNTSGIGALVPVFNSTAPVFKKTVPAFNNAPALAFTPQQGLVENAVEQPVTSYVVVAQHDSAAVAPSEQLVNLRPSETDDVRTSVLNVTGGKKPTAFSPSMSVYELDGLDQTGNLRVQADGGVHVYRATLNGGWPSGMSALGRNTPLAPGWKGSVAALVGLDDSWSTAALESLTDGLAFQYHVAQDDSVLLNVAKASLAKGQDGTGVTVNFDRVAPSTRPTTVSGSVVIPGSVTIPQLPTVAIDTSRRWREYQGSLAGIWRLLTAALHLIEVYVLPTPNTSLSAQYRIGRFEIDTNGRWSTGTKQCGFGYKVVRPVLKSNFNPVTAHPESQTKGIDAQVAIYTRSGVTRTLQGYVPLRPDNTFFATVTGAGQIEADLVAVSNPSTVYGTSVRPLPPTTNGSDAASVADLALACLAMLNLGSAWHYRVQQILNRLAAVQVAGGLIASSLSVASPSTASGDPLTYSNALAAIAALRYEAATGDTQFHAFATGIGTQLAGRINGAHLITSGASSGTACLTTDAVLSYWLFCLLADSTHALQLYGTLATTYWNETLGRFHRGTNAAGTTPDSAHNLWTDLWTMLYCQATGDERATRIRKAMGAFRIRGVEPSDPLPLFPGDALFPSDTLFPEG